jgi:hypothetical protein
VSVWKYKTPPEDYNCNLIIPFGKILLILGNEAWLNVYWEFINRKLFAVCSAGSEVTHETKAAQILKSALLEST